MSNINIDIEQEFFEVFGIEKRHIILEDDYGQYRTRDKMYPEITAEILLKLICIISNYKYVLENLYCENIEELKKQIIKLFIEQRVNEDEDTYKQVRSLFEEEEQCQK